MKARDLEKLKIINEINRKYQELVDMHFGDESSHIKCDKCKGYGYLEEDK